VADRGWRRHFDEPIPLPRGRQLVTLEDAGNYITKLPKADHEAAEWQAAMEALILVATSGGPTMFARIGVMRALNRHVERVFNPDRKDHHWDAASWRAINEVRRLRGLRLGLRSPSGSTVQGRARLHLRRRGSAVSTVQCERR
jgi:hypothetical protein